MNTAPKFTRPTKLSLFVVWTLFAMLPALTSAKTDSADEQAKQPVVIFSSTYCPSCLYVKRYLESKDIPFKEFDIETSVAARDYFVKLGGRGTPFLLVNNKTMQGFNKAKFWHIYGSQSPK